jgi:signal peptidase I
MTLNTASSVAPSSASSDDQASNIKETIESILVAFILAFIFRAFVVEAFVIPTGSMATTLLGAHMRFRCPDCGYQFDVNYNAANPQDADDMQIPSDGYPPGDIYCPNCGYRVAGHEDAQPVRFGDRILVLKYIYLLHQPKRWDVVVFKAPDQPEKTHYTQNFIKRLVGRPGESLMVLDGDIYISTKDDPTWRIQTKPRDVQEAMWRLVYDNDCHPQGLQRYGLAPWTQPWKQESGSGWNTDGAAGNPRIIQFDNATGSGELDFDPNANSTTQTLTDYLAYDIGATNRRPGAVGSPDDEEAPKISDLKLSAYYKRQSGQGDLKLRLVRHESVDHTFIADITPDSVRVIHQTNFGEAQIGPTVKLADLGIKAGDPIYVEFQNVDYQVTLRLNGKEVIQSTPADYQPNVPWLMQQWYDKKHSPPGGAAIEAENQTCTLEHVSLWRDVYYTDRQRGGDAFLWASPPSPVTLGANEYFVMGDNSEVSSDARYWGHPIELPREGLDVQSGRVPAQFLLGQAVFVYWPAGFRAMGTRLSVVPDFGDMRWIH